MSTSEVYCASPSISQKHRIQRQRLSFHSMPELCIEESPVVNMDPGDAFITDTKILVEACIQAALKGSVYNYGGLSSGLKDMVRCIVEMGRSNRDSFEEMCDQLELSTSNVYMSVHRVLSSIFDDGIVNWGRTVALLAFGGHLANFCSRNRLGEVVDSIAPWIAVFISSFMNLKGWVLEHGGWVSG